MKKLILCVCLFGLMGIGHAQIVLKEAKVSYDPSSLKIDPITNSVTLKVPEARVGEFSQDPLMFVKNKFDIYSVLDANKKDPYNSYNVWFQSKKGYLLANFDKKGNLVSSSQKFKNVMLPEETRNQIRSQYGDHVVLVSSKFLATSDGWNINRAFYRVKIKDGKKTKSLRIDAPDKLTLAGL